MKTNETPGRAKRHSVGRLVGRIAFALARQHAEGWQAHAQLVGEKRGMSAGMWAQANCHLFIEQAREIVAPNGTREPRGGKATNE